MSIGYPAVGAVGGAIASILLREHSWHYVFYFGFTLTVLFIPIVYFFIPESVHWLARKQPAGALEKVNKAMRHIGKATVAALPQVDEETRKLSVLDIFRPGLIADDADRAGRLLLPHHHLLLHLEVGAEYRRGDGLPRELGRRCADVVHGRRRGGGAMLGLLTMRFGLKGLTIGVLAAVDGVGHDLRPDAGRSQPARHPVCFFAGFFTNAGIVGLYAIFAHAYPTHVRATGTGFAIGVGRGGSVLAPAVAGFLFQARLGCALDLDLDGARLARRRRRLGLPEAHSGCA